MPQTAEQFEQAVNRLRARSEEWEFFRLASLTGKATEAEFAEADRKQMEALERMRAFAPGQPDSAAPVEIDEFHWTNGVFFKREKDGVVRVRIEPGQFGNERRTTLYIPAAEWASIVASVSHRSETAESYSDAVRLHMSGAPSETPPTSRELDEPYIGPDAGSEICPECGELDFSEHGGLAGHSWVCEHETTPGRPSDEELEAWAADTLEVLPPDSRAASLDAKRFATYLLRARKERRLPPGGVDATTAQPDKPAARPIEGETPLDEERLARILALAAWELRETAQSDRERAANGHPSLASIKMFQDAAEHDDADADAIDALAAQLPDLLRAASERDEAKIELAMANDEMRWFYTEANGLRVKLWQEMKGHQERAAAAESRLASLRQQLADGRVRDEALARIRQQAEALTALNSADIENEFMYDTSEPPCWISRAAVLQLLTPQTPET